MILIDLYKVQVIRFNSCIWTLGVKYCNFCCLKIKYINNCIDRESCKRIPRGLDKVQWYCSVSDRPRNDRKNRQGLNNYIINLIKITTSVSSPVFDTLRDRSSLPGYKKERFSPGFFFLDSLKKSCLSRLSLATSIFIILVKKPLGFVIQNSK